MMFQQRQILWEGRKQEARVRDNFELLAFPVSRKYVSHNPAIESFIEILHILPHLH